MGHTTESSWVPSVALRVRIPGAEAAALLLDGSGRVRGDADLVFHGQPTHPSGAAWSGPSGLVLDLNGVEPEVERIVVAGWSRHGGFGEPPVLDAVGPDGTPVLSYVPEGVPDVSAAVLGVFFREAGGWKFDGLGEGYGSGFAGLVTAYGVEVAEDERVPVLPGPVPLAGVVKMPRQAPPPGGYLPGVFPPPERPYRLVEGWEFGEVFEPFTAEGHGHRVIAVDPSVPPGPVLVELAHEGEGYVSLYPLDEKNKDEDFLFASPLPDFRGSRVFDAPRKHPLRFRITATGRWRLRVLPVAAARQVEGVLHGYGPEALLHPGGPADLRIDFYGDAKVENAYISLYTHEVAGRTSLGTDDRLLLSDNGRLRRSVPLADGPLVLRHYAAGPWTLTVEELD
ncbi:TerD family protein [Streptomyces sp. NPDC053513]|uniref:TerD family protein n=1 Tax=unclassified Streptomyces TaxID=2593676 RepID=UPI0037D82A81